MKDLLGFLIFSFLLAVPALGAGPGGAPETIENIRVIGNGGGEDEMAELSRTAEVKEYLEVCQYPDNPCDLSEKQIQLVAEILKQDRVEEFALRSGSTEQQSLRDHLLSRVSWKVFSIPIHSLNAKVRILTQQSIFNRIIVYATPEKGTATNLSILITNVLACRGGATDMQLISRPQTSTNGLSMPVEWDCEGRRYGATLRLSASIQGEKENLTWKASLFAVRMIEAKPKACPHQLVY